MKQTEYSFNGEKFKEFLADIRDACGNEKVYLFIDNATVHGSELSKDGYAEYNIEPIYNVPYHF